MFVWYCDLSLDIELIPGDELVRMPWTVSRQLIRKISSPENTNKDMLGSEVEPTSVEPL